MPKGVDDMQFRFTRPDRQVLAKKTTYGPVTTNNGQAGTFFGTGTWYQLLPFTLTEKRVLTVPGITGEPANDWGWGIFAAKDVDLKTNRVPSGTYETYPKYNVEVDTMELEAGDYVAYIVNWSGASSTHKTLEMWDLLQALTMKPGRFLTFPGRDTLYDKFGKLWGLLANNNVQFFGGLGLGGASTASGNTAFAQGRSEAAGAYSVALGNSRSEGVYSLAHGHYAIARNQASTAFGGHSQAGGNKKGYNQVQRAVFGGNSYSSGPNAQEVLIVAVNRVCTVESVLAMRHTATGKAKVVRGTAVIKTNAAGDVTILNPQFTTLYADAGTDSWGYAFAGFGLENGLTSEIQIQYTAEAGVNWGGEVKISELA